MPNALIEAYTYGIPVITSDWMGHDEIIKNNVDGLVFQMNNMKELVDCMSKIADSDILFEKSSENESLKNDNFLLKIIITRKDDKIHNMEKDIKYMKTEAQKFASEFDEFKKNIH